MDHGGRGIEEIKRGASISDEENDDSRGKRRKEKERSKRKNGVKWWSSGASYLFSLCHALASSSTPPRIWPSAPLSRHSFFAHHSLSLSLLFLHARKLLRSTLRRSRKNRFSSSWITGKRMENRGNDWYYEIEIGSRRGEDARYSCKINFAWHHFASVFLDAIFRYLVRNTRLNPFRGYTWDISFKRMRSIVDT